MPRTHRPLPDLQVAADARPAPALSGIVAIRPAQLKTAVQLLRQSIDDLYVAASNCELDRKSHGPNVRKNRATFANHVQLTTLCHEVVQLLRDTRQAAALSPTPGSQRKLMECERLLVAWIDSFGPCFDPPPRIVH